MVKANSTRIYNRHKYTTCKQQHNCSLKHKNRFIENRPITRPHVTTTQISCQSEKSARPSRYYWGYVRVSLRRWRQQLFTLVELAVTVPPRHQLSWPRAVLVVTWQTAVPGWRFITTCHAAVSVAPLRIWLPTAQPPECILIISRHKLRVIRSLAHFTSPTTNSNN